MRPDGRHRSWRRLRILVRRETWNEKEAIARRRREVGGRPQERNRRPVVRAKRHSRLWHLGPIRIAGIDVRENLHVLEYRAQFECERSGSLVANTEACERGDVTYVLEGDAHVPISRSRLACATTSLLRPTDSSSKSTFALSSRPDPASSAIVPAPK